MPDLFCSCCISQLPIRIMSPVSPKPFQCFTNGMKPANKQRTHRFRCHGNYRIPLLVSHRVNAKVVLEPSNASHNIYSLKSLTQGRSGETGFAFFMFGVNFQILFTFYLLKPAQCFLFSLRNGKMLLSSCA